MSLKGLIFKISKSGIYFKQESNPPKLKNVWEKVVSVLGFGRPTTHFFATKMNKSGQATIMNFSFFPHRPFADQFVCQKYDNVMEFMCDMQYVWLSSLQLITLALPIISCTCLLSITCICNSNHTTTLINNLVPSSNLFAVSLPPIKPADFEWEN